MIHRRKSPARRSLLEGLESRTLFATQLTALNLPGKDSVWSYPAGVLNGSPIMADVNADGKDDIIAIGGNGNLYAYTLSGSSLSLVRSFIQPGTPSQVNASPVVTDFPGQGRVVVAAAFDGRVFAWRLSDGGLVPGWPFQLSVPDFQQAAVLTNTVYQGITAADLDNDGIAEIITPSINHTVTAIRSSGQLYWQFNNDDTVIGTPVVGDINRDGRVEVVFGGDSTLGVIYNNGGRITTLSGDGRRISVYEIDEVPQSSPALADLDADGFLDIVIGTGFAAKEQNPGFGLPVPNDSNKVFAINRNGQLLPGWPYVTDPVLANLGNVYPGIAIADLNNDGQLDVIAADGQGRVHAIRANGTQLWRAQAFTTAQKIFNTPIVGDINNDNVPDVIIGTDTTMRAFSGTDGAQVFNHVDHTNIERYTSSPAIGHLKGDATWQMVFSGVTVSATAPNVRSPGVLRTYDLGTTSAVPWPMFRRTASSNALVRPDSVTTPTITSLFQKSLGRTPSGSELAFWTPFFRNSPLLAEPIKYIIGSAEQRNNLISLNYAIYLNRAADPGGRTFFQGYLNSNASYAQLGSLLLSSGEAFALAGGNNQAWVTYMYQKTLGRTPDSGGLTFYTNLLNGGFNRSDLTYVFFVSQEYTENLIRAYYSAYSPGGQSTPTPENLRMASWDLRRGLTEETVLSAIIESNGDYASTRPESSYIRQVYLDALNRAATQEDRVGWLTALELRQNDFAGIARAVLSSGEYRTRLVTAYYNRYLDRAPTPTELNTQVTALANGLSRKQLIDTLCTSNEFFTLSGSTLSGFVTRSFQKLIGRSPTAGESTTWTTNPNAPFTRQVLPNALLVSDEYLRNTVDSYFYKYLRRLSSTTANYGALFDGNAPFGGQGYVDLLKNDFNPEELQVIFFASGEYQAIAFGKAIWSGFRWKNDSRTNPLPPVD